MSDMYDFKVSDFANELMNSVERGLEDGIFEGDFELVFDEDTHLLTVTRYEFDSAPEGVIVKVKRYKLVEDE